jgi:predicted homoserine dehydrogenase-like protein
MILSKLFDSIKADRPVRAGVIGTGQYAAAVVTQSMPTERLQIVVLQQLAPKVA